MKGGDHKGFHFFLLHYVIKIRSFVNNYVIMHHIVSIDTKVQRVKSVKNNKKN